MTIYSAVLIQYQRVTDGQTDRQTDVQPIIYYVLARKNRLRNASIIIEKVSVFPEHTEVVQCSSLTLYGVKFVTFDVTQL